nr:ComEC/Rec2 family competence protein [candidate division Zixibacteria bacterium]
MARKHPAILVLGAVAAGIVLADYFDIASWIFLFVALLFFPLIVWLYLKDHSCAAVLAGLVCLTALSAFSYTFRIKSFPPGHIIHLAGDGRNYTIFGTVTDWPVIKRHQTTLLLDVDSLGYEGVVRKGKGRLLLKIATETTLLEYGDRIIYHAKIYPISGGPGPTGFNYRRYLNLKEVFGTTYLPHLYTIQIDPIGGSNFYRVIGSMRSFIIDVFSRTLDSHTAALASGFLIGETRNIPVDIYNLFRDSGTLHLLAVSGSNVALIVGLFLIILRASPLKTTGRIVILLTVIVFFSFLSYNQPSVVRAAVMAALVILGRALQRRIELNNIIAATAVIILVFKPTELFDVGFQLSFITAWGLIFFVPRIDRLFGGLKTRWYYRYLILPVLVCAVAQIVSLPLSAYYFQRLPVISFLSNLVIVPLVSLMVVGEVILILSSMLLPELGFFVGSLLNPPGNLILNFLEIFGSGDLSVLLKFQVSGVILGVYFILVTLVFFGLSSLRARRMAVLAILIIANIGLSAHLFASGRGKRMTIFPVPGGMVMVNHGPPAQVIMTDLIGRDYLISETIIAPYLNISRVDRPDIIALSDDYATVREAAFLTDMYPGSQVYIPSGAIPVYFDIRGSDSLMIDSARTRFYTTAEVDFRDESPDIFLSENLIIYDCDSLALVFAGEDYNLADLVESVRTDSPADKLVLVKPNLSRSDQEILKGISDRLDVVISDRFKAVPGLYENEPPEYFETAQAGVIELVIKDGRISVED